MTLEREIAAFFASHVKASAQGDAGGMSKLLTEVAPFADGGMAAWAARKAPGISK